MNRLSTIALAAGMFSMSAHAASLEVALTNDPEISLMRDFEAAYSEAVVTSNKLNFSRLQRRTPFLLSKLACVVSIIPKVVAIKKEIFGCEKYTTTIYKTATVHSATTQVVYSTITATNAPVTYTVTSTVAGPGATATVTQTSVVTSVSTVSGNGGTVTQTVTQSAGTVTVTQQVCPTSGGTGQPGMNGDTSQPY